MTARFYAIQQSKRFARASRPMDGAAFRKLGAALFAGAWDWQARLAAVFSVTGRTVRRWASGERPVPTAVACAVRVMTALQLGDSGGDGKI